MPDFIPHPWTFRTIPGYTTYEEAQEMFDQMVEDCISRYIPPNTAFLDARQQEMIGSIMFHVDEQRKRALWIPANRALILAELYPTLDARHGANPAVNPALLQKAPPAPVAFPPSENPNDPFPGDGNDPNLTTCMWDHHTSDCGDRFRKHGMTNGMWLNHLADNHGTPVGTSEKRIVCEWVYPSGDKCMASILRGGIWVHVRSCHTLAKR